MICFDDANDFYQGVIRVSATIEAQPDVYAVAGEPFKIFSHGDLDVESGIRDGFDAERSLLGQVDTIIQYIRILISGQSTIVAKHVNLHTLKECHVDELLGLIL